MELLDNKKKEYIERLLLARLRLLNKHSFYGLLLMSAKFGLDLKCETAYTDGKRICFSPSFMDELNDSELELVLMHEILHIVLKHCYRGLDYDNHLFNIACDIVVNSNILKSNNMDISSITTRSCGTLMHIAPDGKEGYNYTAEEVYEMFKIKMIDFDSSKFDDHSKWNKSDELKEEWNDRLVSAINAINETNGVGKVPLGVLREYNKLINPQLNWREILKYFLSYETADYSFQRPDKRFPGDFFIPDFCEEEEVLKANLLFAVDTSGSITSNQLGMALTEIKSAIDESNMLDGYVICLDAEVYEPISLHDFDIESFNALGGGGTNFTEFFESLPNIMKKINGTIDLIIFITDGCDEFPKEELRGSTPVLWIINNDEITPPWGMVARITE